MIVSEKMTVRRRDVIAAMGGSATLGIAMGPKDVLGKAGDKIDVVMEYKGSEPYHVERLPRSWVNYTEKVKRTSNSLTRKNKNTEGVFDFCVVAGKKMKGGKEVNQIRAIIKKGSGAEKQIPDSKNGVPIEIKEVEKRDTTLLTHSGCENNGVFDHYDGGIWIEIPSNDDNSGTVNGTATCTVHNNNNTDYALTANHLFNGGALGDCDGNWDEDAYQHYQNADQHVGVVDKYREKMDYALLPLDGLNPSSDISSAQWNGQIVSHASDNRLAELVQDETTIEQMGYVTGATTGELKSKSRTDTGDCVNTDNNGIRFSCDVIEGDSGGPVYTESENSAGDITMIGHLIGTNNLMREGMQVCDNANHDQAYKSGFGAPSYVKADEFNLTYGSS